MHCGMLGRDEKNSSHENARTTTEQLLEKISKQVSK